MSLCLLLINPLIPAKAGTHRAIGCLQGRDPFADSAWVPAFAGMSGGNAYKAILYSAAILAAPEARAAHSAIVTLARAMGLVR